MTTTIALETSRGNLSLAMSLWDYFNNHCFNVKFSSIDYKKYFNQKFI